MKDMDIKTGHTQRGFRRHDFKDTYGEPCSLLKSSTMAEDCIWLGPNGGTLYDINDNPVTLQPGQKIVAKMHLSQSQVKALLPMLQHFVETGELP